jgi:hypothetical protein
MKCAALTLAITRVSAALGADSVSCGVVIEASRQRTAAAAGRARLRTSAADSPPAKATI